MKYAIYVKSRKMPEFHIFDCLAIFKFLNFFIISVKEVM